MWPGGMDHMGWMWGWWIVGLAVVVLVVWAITRAAAPTTPHEDNSPETILKRRYARGEISDEDYARQLQQLRK